jgi:thymidylate synthase
MKQYHDLVEHVLHNGTRKENRTGVDTLSTFGYYYEHDLRDGFPLLTTKAVSWKNIVVELLWFLSGSDKAEFLERHGCKFWEPWYLDNGRVMNCYGPAWRKFPVHKTVTKSDGGEFPLHEWDETHCSFNDQVGWLVNELKTKPYSRRMVVTAWSPGDAQTAPLPPCHAMWVVNVQNEEPAVALGYVDSLKPDPIKRACLHLTQRSCDVALGIPYNLASYALLLQLLSRFSGLEPGIFGHTLIDAHIYTGKPDGSMAEYDHIPGLLDQLTRKPYPLPQLVIDDSIRSLSDVEALLHPSVTTDALMAKFKLEGYQSHPAIKFKVAV